MKKILLLLSASLLVLSSCSSDENPSDNNNSQDLLLKKIVDNDLLFGTISTNFTYNGNKLVEINRYDEESDIYTYTGNLITKIEKFKVYYAGTEDVETELISIDYFEYNANNQLIEFKSVYANYEIERKTTYVYNNDNTISFEQKEYFMDNDPILLKTGTITLQSGEISKLQVIKTFDSYTDNYTYDNKNSIFKNVVGYDKLILALIIGEQGSSTMVKTIMGGVSHNFVNNGEFQYTYNSDNYPVTVNQSFFGMVLHSAEFFYY